MKPLVQLMVSFIVAFGGSAAMALEKPEYETLVKTDQYELRRYSPYVIAEVDVPGDFKQAGNEAFRILAGYIFGDNHVREKMSMTAPVESKPRSDGRKMKMTAPVESTASAGGYTYAFVMERKYTLDTIPQPNDSRVRLRQLPARTMAVRRYSGGWSQDKYRQQELDLLQALADDGLAPLGEPVFARYNPPFTPWFLRRNEILVEIAERQAAID